MTSREKPGVHRFTVRRAVGGTLFAMLALSLSAGCGPSGTPLDSPAGSGASLPRLTTDPEGTAWLSWVEPDGEEHVLKFSRLEARGWSPPGEAARGAGWFVNWADFPSVVHAGDGRVGAHWLKKREGGPYAYDVVMSVSTDGGLSWSAPTSPHSDGTPTEHGFATLFPVAGGIGAVWLDGRNTGATGEGPDGGHHGHGGTMTLRTGGLDWTGRPLPGIELDAMTCDCCQTGAAEAAGGIVVVYRDRSAEEIRDISMTIIGPEGPKPPVPVAEDGWEMPACPVNGPAIEAKGQRVAVAWFTAASERHRVQLALSDDGGVSFGEPVLIEDGPNLGRVDVALAPDGSAVVSWLALEGKEAVIRYRAVSPQGEPGRVSTLATTSAARSSGFPQMARSGDQLVFAWTIAGEPSRVETARAPLP